VLDPAAADVGDVGLRRHLARDHRRLPREGHLGARDGLTVCRAGVPACRRTARRRSFPRQRSPSPEAGAPASAVRPGAVDGLAQVRFEFDQAGEAADDALKLVRALQRGEVLWRLPLQAVDDHGPVDAAMHGRGDEPGELRGDLFDDVDVDVADLVLIGRLAAERVDERRLASGLAGADDDLGHRQSPGALPAQVQRGTWRLAQRAAARRCARWSSASRRASRIRRARGPPRGTADRRACRPCRTRPCRARRSERAGVR